MPMVYFVTLRGLNVEMISHVLGTSREHSPSFMPEYEREIFSFAEPMKTKLASAKRNR
jgi:hypothetical protein